MANETITIPEAARRLGLSRRRVRVLLDTGRISGEKIPTLRGPVWAIVTRKGRPPRVAPASREKAA